MTTAKPGTTVKVHYTGTLDDGTVFDSSAGREPIEFTIGQQTVIAGFENAVIGLSVGDKKKISIAPDDAYGAHRADKVAVVDRSELPPDLEPATGMVLRGDTPEGQVTFTIAAVEADSVTLDGNHPLAGKQLNFELELVEVMD
jgi:peptidylprolyl isomerase